MWRLLSWTYRINILVLIAGVAIAFYRETLGISLIGLSMANLGLREKTQAKIGDK